MLAHKKALVWAFVFYVIMLVLLCAPFLFEIDDDDPDPADEREGGQENGRLFIYINRAAITLWPDTSYITNA